MFDNFKTFLSYRRQNKIFSKELNIKKRDLKVEIYLLFGIWKSERFLKRLKRSCRCYQEYYEERDKEITFGDLNYIVSRVATIYNLTNNEELFETELNNFDNYFMRSYIKNKTEELLNKVSDTKGKNLIVEAVM